MSISNCKLVHWIVALAICMSTLAPSISKAISLLKGDDVLVMEVCSASSGKLEIQLEIESHDDNAATREHCPYCLAHGSIIPTFKTNLKLEVPKTLVLLPYLFYKSPQPLLVWITPPSAAPPAKS